MSSNKSPNTNQEYFPHSLVNSVKSNIYYHEEQDCYFDVGRSEAFGKELDIIKKNIVYVKHRTGASYPYNYEVLSSWGELYCGSDIHIKNMHYKYTEMLEYITNRQYWIAEIRKKILVIHYWNAGQQYHYKTAPRILTDNNCPRLKYDLVVDLLTKNDNVRIKLQQMLSLYRDELRDEYMFDELMNKLEEGSA